MIWIEMLTMSMSIAFANFVIYTYLLHAAVVWVLWLATASATTETFILGCSFFDFGVPEFCPEVTAVKAFCYLTWITCTSSERVLSHPS